MFRDIVIARDRQTDETHFRFLGLVHASLSADRWAPFTSITLADIDRLMPEVSNA